MPIYPLLLSLLATGSLHAQGGWRAESERAVARAASAILSHQSPEGHFAVREPGDEEVGEDYPMGVTALALHALLRAGFSPDDPAILRARRALRYMAPRRTYGVGVLLTALEAQGLPEDDGWIAELATWLVEARDRESGLWAYPGGPPDLSNSQIAALGLWAAERRGFEVPDEVWRDLLAGTVERVRPDGGFGYREHLRPESAGTTTTAGLTVLELALPRLEGRRMPASLRRAATRAQGRAWSWLDMRFTPTGNPADAGGRIRDRYPGVFRLYVAQTYWLYGLERVASLAGRDRIGGRDWYREGAIELLRSEFEGGGWGPLEVSCLAVLFLARSTGTALDLQNLPDFPHPVYWRATAAAPDPAWIVPGFDDGLWALAAGAFGRPGAGPLPVRGPWTAGELWLRRWVRGADLAHLHLMARGEVEIFVNGHRREGLVLGDAGYTELDLSEGLDPRGEHLLAVHALPCEDPLLDLLFHEPHAGRDVGWWKGRPRSDVPFIRRWLVLGPIPDPHGSALLRDPIGNLVELPREGMAGGRQRWRTHGSDAQLLELETATAKADRCLRYASTGLEVAADTRAILWLGANDGLRVWLDGELRFHHPYDQLVLPDQYGLELELTGGWHVLTIGVDDTGGESALAARLAGVDGRPLPTVRPLLGRSEDHRRSGTRQHPDLYTLDELLHLLPPAARSRVDFARTAPGPELAIGTCALGFPSHDEEGGRLLLAAPDARGGGVRVALRLRLPAGADRLELGIAGEDGPATFDLSIFDGELHALSDSPPITDGKLSIEVERWAGRDVLVLVNVRSPSDQPLGWKSWHIR